MAQTLLTRKQVAEILQVSVDTITSMVDDGQLPAIVIRRGSKRILRFSTRDLDATLDRFKTRDRASRYRITPRVRPTQISTGMEADPWQLSNAAQKKAPLATR